MFKELPYFQHLQADLAVLQQSSKELNALLSNAYTPPQTVYCSLRNHIDSVFVQQEQLFSLLAIILQQVESGSFVPVRIDALVTQLAPTWLPDWFETVAESEFGKAKSELDTWARKLAVLHELTQKHKDMRREREALQTLYRRWLALSSHCTDIDIMQDVTRLRDRIKHIKKTFHYFCSQVASKITEFFQQLIDRASNLARPQSPPSLHQGRKAMDVFRQGTALDKVHSAYFASQLPQQSFKLSNEARSISPKKYILSARSNDSKTRPSLKIQSPDGYYERSKDLKRQYLYTLPQQQQLTHSPCCNHHQGHRHTCDKGSKMLRSIKSQQRFQGALYSNRYNYRRYMPANGSSEYYA